MTGYPLSQFGWRARGVHSLTDGVRIEHAPENAQQFSRFRIALRDSAVYDAQTAHRLLLNGHGLSDGSDIERVPASAYRQGSVHLFVATDQKPGAPAAVKEFGVIGPFFYAPSTKVLAQFARDVSSNTEFLHELLYRWGGPRESPVPLTLEWYRHKFQ